jgi:hypothetical protein
VTCGHLNLIKLSCIEQIYACAARSSTARWLELPAVVGVQKYLDYGERVTTVRYPGVGFSAKEVTLIASTAVMHVCARVENWIASTPAINRAIRDRLNELEAFGPRSTW